LQAHDDPSKGQDNALLSFATGEVLSIIYSLQHPHGLNVYGNGEVTNYAKAHWRAAPPFGPLLPPQIQRAFLSKQL
jgi:hypothetical protein